MDNNICTQCIKNLKKKKRLVKRGEREGIIIIIGLIYPMTYDNNNGKSAAAAKYNNN